MKIASGDKIQIYTGADTDEKLVRKMKMKEGENSPQGEN